MFKAAFPWATKQDEDNERDYLKSFDTTDPAEVAGNVWYVFHRNTRRLHDLQNLGCANPSVSSPRTQPLARTSHAHSSSTSRITTVCAHLVENFTNTNAIVHEQPLNLLKNTVSDLG